MSKKKITLIIIPVAVLILLAALFIYNSTFTIEYNDKVIKYKIEAFINRGTTPETKITIKNEIRIADIKIISFAASSSEGNSFGYCTLAESPFKEKFKIKSVRYGTGLIYLPVFSTKSGKYLIAIGKEYNKKATYVKVKLDDNSYTFDIKSPYFILYKKVPNDISTSEVAEFKFFDENHEEISDLGSLEKL
ncbi:hypothetical protein [Clostridium sp. BNL1100]|uniref:hypothetical protein n=1 Tax=Clostridium sp. BNL1100 TaxID=755731 RepID=UPI00024A7C8C|nr:hypothetical protein [Clostridium sp. BNL1100]AEY65340.1 hypothetical protein Clo1100_1088 [Clostridium sp. BNL1100]